MDQNKLADRLLEVNFGSLYWMMQMDQEIANFMRREGSIAAVKQWLGKDYIGVLTRPTGTNFLEFVEVTKDIVQTVKALDGTDPEGFQALEDLLFYAGEFLNTFERLGAQLDLIDELSGFEAHEWDEIRREFWSGVAAECGYVY